MKTFEEFSGSKTIQKAKVKTVDSYLSFLKEYPPEDENKPEEKHQEIKTELKGK